MADKEQIGKMIDSIINKNAPQDEVHFHKYLPGKMQEVLYGTNIESDEAENSNKEE